jgi:hypothetical protein
MDRQKSLWDDEFFADLQAKLHARRPMSHACQEILTHITGRWASSIELAELSRKYTSHLSELRQRGYQIDTQRSDGGWLDYRLHETE